MSAFSGGGSTRTVGILPAGLARGPLIGPDDPPPVALVQDAGRAPLLLVADHGGAAIPARLAGLGLDAEALGRHIAFDIGAAALTRRLAVLLDAPAVIAQYSRLLIDPNRSVDRADAIPEISDGVVIPGNRSLSEGDRRHRIDSFYRPYHDTVAAWLSRLRRRHGRVSLIAIHSFTPVFQGCPRPWQVGVLWGADSRLARPLLRRLAADSSLCVGDNQPYDGRDNWGGTVWQHAVPAGLPHVALEVRQDLIADAAGVDDWAHRLAPLLAVAVAGLGRDAEAAD